VFNNSSIPICMDKSTFIRILNSDNRDYRNRLPLMRYVLQHRESVAILLTHMNDVTNKNSNFAGRILESTCKKDLTIILPYINTFCELLPKLNLDGALRASVKIIELFTVEYFIKYNPVYIENLHETHLEQFAERCFDCMISDRAIAIQAHSMYALYLLGTRFDWIHPELKEILNNNLPLTSSAGYQNRGKKIIEAILDNTGKLLKLY